MDHGNLPPAAKLAALIEAGRAANPQMHQCQGAWFDDKGGACAMGFAAMGAGVGRNVVGNYALMNRFFGIVGVRSDRWMGFSSPITRMNDNGASLAEICASLREGELAKVAA
jgi:hypothetical protein